MIPPHSCFSQATAGSAVFCWVSSPDVAGDEIIRPVWSLSHRASLGNIQVCAAGLRLSARLETNQPQTGTCRHGSTFSYRLSRGCRISDQRPFRFDVRIRTETRNGRQHQLPVGLLKLVFATLCNAAPILQRGGGDRIRNPDVSPDVSPQLFRSKRIKGVALIHFYLYIIQLVLIYNHVHALRESLQIESLDLYVGTEGTLSVN